ncbi:MAG: DUF3048 domain-containing protein [Agathobacter sp.]|nr:DUF3048 domain-containing protein [Agathobacter sp.]
MRSRQINEKIIALILGISLGLLLILVAWQAKIQESPRLEGQTQIGSNLTENTSETGQNSEITTEPETQPDTEIEAPVLVLNENPLTGEFNLTDGAVGKRPIAVMINNINKAMPQYGIAEADIIFEIPVEGYLTRFMAVYADYTQMPKICSIRSCRPYFPAIAKGFDAVYVYCGMADVIKDYVNSLDIDVFNGGRNHGGLFARDQERRNAGYALEHTMYFDGTGIVEAMEKRKLRSDIVSEKEGNAFLFNEGDELVRPEGENCTVVEIDFGAAKATLTYDLDTNTYLKELNGNPQVDGVTGTQLAFTNVFVLETTITTADYGIHKDVDWHGGTGYYVSNGAVQEITWSKKDEESSLKFYDVDGNELAINRGKSYIAINRKNRTEFIGAVTEDMIR